MSEEQTLKLIDNRLSRIEAELSKYAVTSPGPVVDPVPWGGGNWGGYIPRWPIPIPVDPAPWGGGWGGGVPRWPVPAPVDPAPWGGGFVTAPTRPPQVGPIGDPPPFDLGSLNMAQLESSLHNISADKARLDSMENLIKDQITKLSGKAKTKKE